MWKIISKPIDTYEISPTDTQHEYIIYVKDDSGQNIDGELAYGKAHRQTVTETMAKKYGDKIKFIEHLEE